MCIKLKCQVCHLSPRGKRQLDSEAAVEPGRFPRIPSRKQAGDGPLLGGLCCACHRRPWGCQWGPGLPGGRACPLRDPSGAE